MTQLYIISANHLTTTAQERLLLHLSESQWNQLAMHMSNGHGVAGMVKLQTCNRLEIIYQHDNNVSDDIIETWLSLIGHREISEQHFECCVGTEASIKYILKLSLGFQSAIYGDDQILYQLKSAFEFARVEKRLSSLLERTYQTMMRVHKQVCRETNYRSHTISLAYQALKAVRSIVTKPNLKNKHLLIIGAGEMAKQVLKYIPKFQFASVSITNRTMSKAEVLAQDNNLVLVDYNENLTGQFEVVISCTDQGKTRLCELQDMELYVDLSLSSVHIEDLHIPYVLLDELEEIISKSKASRMNCIDEVEAIISKNTDVLLDWYSRWLERRMEMV